MWHFYLTATIWISAYTLFAYSVVIFLHERLESELWVGLFLAIGSIIAIFMDIPFGYLQKIFKPRSLLISATILMMICVGIFLIARNPIIFILGAAILYGISHDLYDVTMISYILNNSIPAHYGENISQRSVAEALGIVFGLLFSGALLYFGATTAQIGLEIILAIAIIVIFIFFDRSKEKKIKLPTEIKKTITHTVQNLTADTIKGLKVAAIKVIDITENGYKSLKDATQGKKIILKKLTPKKANLFSKMGTDFKESFSSIGSIFLGNKVNIPLLWSMIILLIFSFWDTFVITFEPLFLNTFLKEIDLPRFVTTGSIMTLFLMPLFALLLPFSKIADKYGRHKIIIFGLLTSGISMIFFGLATNLGILIVSGMSNSIGYAAIMPSVQAMFAEKFNEHVAIINNRSEIDTNTSAAPLKMIINLGNVIGQIAGGILIFAFGFNIFFIIFGVFIIGVLIFSISIYSKLKKPPFILNETGAIISE